MQEDEQGNYRNKNDVDDNSEKRRMALWREQGTDHASFDRSEKPLDDLAMICSAAVGGRKGGGCTRKDVPSQVPGTKVGLRKRKEKREEANVTRCNVNAMQLKLRAGEE